MGGVAMEFGTCVKEEKSTHYFRWKFWRRDRWKDSGLDGTIKLKCILKTEQACVCVHLDWILFAYGKEKRGTVVNTNREEHFDQLRIHYILKNDFSPWIKYLQQKYFSNCFNFGCL